MDLLSIENQSITQFHLNDIVYFDLFGNVGLSTGANVGLIVGCTVAGIVGPFVIFCIIAVCLRLCRSPAATHPYLPNAAYIKSGGPVQSPVDDNVFKSGGFKSYCYQSGELNESGEMKLAFSSQVGHIVSGEGTDSTGAYVVTGHYSPSTLGMELQKLYRTETGDSSENSKQIVTVDFQWNPTSQQFEEKKNIWSRLRKGHDQLIIVPETGKHRRPFYVRSNV